VSQVFDEWAASHLSSEETAALAVREAGASSTHRHTPPCTICTACICRILQGGGVCTDTFPPCQIYTAYICMTYLTGRRVYVGRHCQQVLRV